jgi:hypothetical protein
MCTTCVHHADMCQDDRPISIEMREHKLQAEAADGGRDFMTSRMQSGIIAAPFDRC